jgi:hypothetical protein
MLPMRGNLAGVFRMVGVKQVQASAWFLLPAALLFVGLLPLPYGYYTFLRIIVCLSAAVAAYLASKARARMDPFVAISIALAIVFNPIIPFYLNKGLWSVIDVVAAIWFVLLAYLGRRPHLTLDRYRHR